MPRRILKPRIAYVLGEGSGQLTLSLSEIERGLNDLPEGQQKESYLFHMRKAWECLFNNPPEPEAP